MSIKATPPQVNLLTDRHPFLVVIPFPGVDDKDLGEGVAFLHECGGGEVKPSFLGKSSGFIYFMEGEYLGIPIGTVEI